MGAEITDAKPLDAPALKPLKLANRLAGRAGTPSNLWNYHSEFRWSGGRSGRSSCDPGALVALMNVHAVNGGAACRRGGPAALAEIMSATHGLMFAQQDRHGMRLFTLSTMRGTRKTVFMP